MRPLVAITMGDAAGIGPEVIMKAMADLSVGQECRPLVLGDLHRLEKAGAIVGSRLRVRPISVELLRTGFLRDRRC